MLKARGVYIENAPWADKRQPLAVIDAASIEFTWGSLFKTPRVISRLVLHDAEIDLERQADGLSNWRLRQPQDRGPGLYLIQTLEAHSSNIRFANEGLALDVRFKTSPIEVPAAWDGSSSEETLPSHVDFDGSFHDIPFRGAATTEDVVTFYDTGRLFRLQGELKAGGATLNLAGQFADVLSAVTVDADAVVMGTTLAPFAKFIGRRSAEPRSFSLDGHVKGSAEDYAGKGIRLHIGASDVSGDGRYARDERKTVIRSVLRSNLMDLDDVAWLAGPGAKSDAETSHSSNHFAERAPLQLDISYEARHLHMARVAALQSLSLRATTRGDVLALPKFDLGLADGHAKGWLELDQSRKPRKVSGTVAWEDVHLETLLPAQSGKGRVTGVLRGKARVESAGDTFVALAKALSGSASVSLANGQISSLLDAEIGLQGGKILRNLIGGSKLIPIICATLVVAAEKGHGSIQTLVLDTERERTTGTGTIDLPGEALDLVLTSEAKQPSLLVINKSIRLHGSWLNPARSLIDRAASSEEECKS